MLVLLAATLPCTDEITGNEKTEKGENDLSMGVDGSIFLSDIETSAKLFSHVRYPRACI